MILSFMLILKYVYGLLKWLRNNLIGAIQIIRDTLGGGGRLEKVPF